MKGKSVLFVGCGDLGVRTGELLLARGSHVAAVRRNPARLPTGFAGIAGDYAVPGSLDFIAGLRPDYVVATFNPSDRSIDGYRRGFAQATANLLSGLGEHRPRQLISVSSTRVFAEREGGWVDESSELSADDPRALAMIEAEQLLLDSPLRASVVRFAGIYGFPGGRLLDRIHRGEICAADPPRYSNRIHRDDCAGFLLHLLDRADAGSALAPVYVGVDDLPALQFEVETWLAQEMGIQADSAGDGAVQAPGRTPDGRIPDGRIPDGRTPDGRTPDGHKRCRNSRLRASGYQLRYPDYRSGYRAVLAGRFQGCTKPR